MFVFFGFKIFCNKIDLFEATSAPLYCLPPLPSLPRHQNWDLLVKLVFLVDNALRLFWLVIFDETQIFPISFIEFASAVFSLS